MGDVAAATAAACDHVRLSRQAAADAIGLPSIVAGDQIELLLPLPENEVKP